MPASPLSIILAMTLLLGACSANHHAVFRVKEVARANPTVVAVDAKQRAVVANRKLGADSSWVRFCSEPSPDVFSVMAQAISAGAALGKSADPKALDLALNAAFSSAEQGSTIPRTQTINMLRELMFRTCERYMNGGYSELELSVQAIRDQRLMISILAVESLTGAVAPKPVSAGAAASGGAGATGEAIVRLDDARKAKDAAQAAHDAAKKSYDDESGADKICDALRSKAEADLKDEEKAKAKSCHAKWAALTTAKNVLKEKTGAHEDLRQLAAGGVSVRTTLGGQSPGGLERASDGQVKDVADAVSAIVKANINDNSEFLFFCMKVFSGNLLTGQDQQDAKKVVTETCLRFLDAEFRAAESRLDMEIAESAARQGATSAQNFDLLWQKVGPRLTDPTNNKKQDLKNCLSQQVASVLTRADRPIAECFENAEGKAGFWECWEKLSLPAQRRVLEAISKCN